MKLEKNIPSTPAKILTSTCFWACVSLIFPIVAYANKSLQPQQALAIGYQDFLRITKYFDSRLFWGLVLGSAFLLLITKLVQLILDKTKPNPDRDMMNYVVDEIFSQLVGIGSIITVANIMILIFGNNPSTPTEVSSITESGWVGLVLWALAAFLMWLKPAEKQPATPDNKKDDTAKNKHV